MGVSSNRNTWLTTQLKETMESGISQSFSSGFEGVRHTLKVKNGIVGLLAGMHAKSFCEIIASFNPTPPDSGREVAIEDPP